jgi:hypothetical protein
MTAGLLTVPYGTYTLEQARRDSEEAWAEMTPSERHESEIQARRIRLHLRSIDRYGRMGARMRLTWRTARSTRRERRMARCVARLGDPDPPPEPDVLDDDDMQEIVEVFRILERWKREEDEEGQRR